MFRCNVLQEDVNETNIDKWIKRLKITTLNNLQKKILKRYDVSSINEYIELIKTNIDKKDKLTEINNLYIKNKNKDLEEEKQKETDRLNKLLKESVKRNNNDVKLRMLTDKDQKKAADLYIKFKTLMEEDTEEAYNYVEDFILKNIIFGIFDKKEMAGIIILDYSKSFKIDNMSSKVNTFYIQELIIDDKFRGKGYGNLLISYAILRCPKDMDYISFMTMETNIQMINIGRKFNFVRQITPSGDKKHNLLFIRTNDKIERDLYKNLSYKKTKSSST
jgi:ribosomal protein S18 acetylase RimI-like enzyme